MLIFHLLSHSVQTHARTLIYLLSMAHNAKQNVLYTKFVGKTFQLRQQLRMVVKGTVRHIDWQRWNERERWGATRQPRLDYDMATKRHWFVGIDREMDRLSCWVGERINTLLLAFNAKMMVVFLLLLSVLLSLTTNNNTRTHTQTHTCIECFAKTFPLRKSCAASGA